MFLSTLWWLLCAHALTDYAIQIPFKNPDADVDRDIYGPWWWGMIAHSLINGAGVSLATGSILLGCGETLIHFMTDTCKCLGVIDARTDQVIHLLSKVAWAILATLS